MPSAPTLADLRRYAVARSLFTPTTLPRAIAKLGFIQADPIRAPARAQDLTLRHRVTAYRAGDLERRYHRLDIEEDFFINYGFVPRSTHALMHPRTARTLWTKAQRARANDVLVFVRQHGVVHPRDVDAHFAHGKVTNWFGGSSNATTQLLDGMHYRGLLRVARRDGGTRLYAPRDEAPGPTDVEAAMDALVDVAIGKYAPLPERSLRDLTSRLYHAVPQWLAERRAAFVRARARCAHTTIDGVTWYWPATESPRSAKFRLSESVRLLAPFDPVVWDRRRFELFWDWAYRFEAYTPAPKRVRGYYALPLLWRDAVIGWGNVTARHGAFDVALGYVTGRAPRDAAYRYALAEELARVELFLGRDRE
ncbi:DNA glycosylase AlkZ-like family protein [Gemmatimonas sp.]|uniref:DNA glycosylase AlkZ-like family protein n=1 Tax=Gemmatimonas sp. TaxID=1962908 RepID=UPI003983273C